MHINAYGEMLRLNLQSEPPAKTGGPKGLRLTISGHGTQLPGEEVIRGPWSANRYLTILQLLGGCAVAVLIFLNRFGIDEMGDVDEHALWRNLLATYFFFQRIEQLVDLYGQGTSLGLAFTLAGGLNSQL